MSRWNSIQLQIREELISSASINKLVDLFFDNMEEKISFVTNLI